MAEELPPGTPEVDDPLLVADLLRLLKVKGAIGRMQLADIVIPTVSLGDVVMPSINMLTPTFRSTDVFSTGTATNPPAGTILADTGPLAAGSYDVIVLCSAIDATSGAAIRFEHRDPANSTNLATWVHQVRTPSGSAIPWAYSLGYDVSSGERLRMVNVVTAGVGSLHDATIFARLRS